MIRLYWLALMGCHQDDTDSGSQVPGDLLTVSESASGRLLFLSPEDGRYKGELCLSEVLPEVCPIASESDETNQCLLFAAEHIIQAGRSTFRLTYSRRDHDVAHSPSGMVAVTATHPPTVLWHIEDLVFSQEGTKQATCPDPEVASCHLNGTHILTADRDGVLVAADTNNSRVLWIEPDSSGSGDVLAILQKGNGSWTDWRNVNHIQLLHDGDRTLLLTTFKARLTEGGLSDRGQIVLWDVTDRQAPVQLWAWPEDGYLAAVHHGMIQETTEGMLLVYAHSLGASEDPDDGLYGSVGFARYNGPDTPPTYLADGLLPDNENPLGFVREAEVFAPNDWLLITDSGCENSASDCGLPGRLLSVYLPTLEPEGQSGGHGDQRFVTLELIPDAKRHKLTFPYDADLYYADEVDPDTLAGVGGCPNEEE